MSIEKTLALVDAIVFTHTGKHLNDLQIVIIKQVLQRKKYLEIAEFYGCTEGHIKDIAYLLWKLLSQALGERVTKNNLRTVLERRSLSENAHVSTANITSETERFVGRNNAIAHLNYLVDKNNKIIVIQGEGGIGKTTLAQQYFLEQNFELVLELLMAKETQNIISVESVLDEWLKRDFNEEPGREFGVSLGRLKRHLESRRIGIIIDNLEPALDRYGKLIYNHRRYLELLRVLADVKVQSTALITSRDRLCESDLTVTHYRLSGLDDRAWQKFFDLRQIHSNISTLQTIHKNYGGNAKAMGIICGVIKEDFESDIDAYWQENQNHLLSETNLKNLVTSQFDRLQSLDSDAYKLLCRLGCYRYQDIPSVSSAKAIALLWDINESDRKQSIESLKNRSLIEYSKGQYWLHPIIRAEAIERLKKSREWQEVNYKVAQDWTNSVKKIVSIEDAIAALEAYYHYLEIQDFEQATKVILKSRDNQWGQFLPLGGTLYRMGLLQPLLVAINSVIDRANSSRDRSELYNILGDLYWISGKIHHAIATQEKTIALVTQSLNSLVYIEENKHVLYCLKILEIDSLLSIGLYKIDLWELQEAANFFQRVIEQTVNTAHYRWGEKASICLALVNSYLGLKKEAIASADVVYNAIVKNQLFEHAGRFAYFMQILGQIYTNIGEFDKALELYENAIAFSQESHYAQVKGKILTGLAIISREQKSYAVANERHVEAIALLERIGAKCDLAEAYFQFGLTLQKLEDLDNSRLQFEKAIQLFTEIEAPKQVEKVNKYSKQ
jgi:tetratricopeptide (TPR) repeat protein